MPRKITLGSIGLAVAAALIAGLAVQPASAAPNRPVRLLGEQVLPYSTTFAGTSVGGLSGIDRDPRTGGYVLISDDRSDKQPARFYTADIDVTGAGVGPVRLTGTHPLLGSDGRTSPSGGVDPEDIRVDLVDRRLLLEPGGRAPAVRVDRPLGAGGPAGRVVRPGAAVAGQRTCC